MNSTRIYGGWRRPPIGETYYSDDNRALVVKDIGGTERWQLVVDKRPVGHFDTPQEARIAYVQRDR